MKIFVLFLTVIVTALIVSSCAKAEEVEYDHQIITDGINQLTFDILPLLNNQNTFFSPYSISSALAMTYAGARGNTEQEMSQVLYFAEDQKVFHPSFQKLNQELENRKREGIVLNNANALWVDYTANLSNDFLNLNNRYYGAGAERLDFFRETEASRLHINEWVEEKTEEKIKDLLSPGDVTPDTRLILTNAIYFLGSWLEEFNPEMTREQNFYVTPQRGTRVPFMRRDDSLQYVEKADYQMVQLPYTGEELAMVIILPKKDIPLASIIENLDNDKFNEALESLTIEKVDLQLPKFKFEAKYNMKDMFRKLGMIEAFSEYADFTAMTSDEERFFIDEIIHQAFVEVDEKGTEAAAATAVVMRTTSIDGPQPIIFRADRPFLFFINDTVTNTILFSGTLINPQK
ncbi:MAG: serpin family protein [Candidatus Cloacimonetes bacterium]|nr:serpin family protein [Candidatus Cloacimonadota bacterium]